MIPLFAAVKAFSIGKWVVYLVIVAIIVATLYGLYMSIYNSGYRAGEQLLKDYITNQKEKTVEVERIVEKVVIEVQEKVVEKVRHVKVQGETIVKEVPVYVTKTDDAACELRTGFVRVHDAAASGVSVTGPAPESDREAGGVALSEATAVIADNYKTCRVWREQVIGWQEFWGRYASAIKDAGCVPAQ